MFHRKCSDREWIVHRMFFLGGNFVFSLIVHWNQKNLRNLKTFFIWVFPGLVCIVQPQHSEQESRAIAKMTTRCALYVDALKIFGSPWLRPRLLFPKLSVNGLWLRSIVLKCVGLQNLNFIALRVPEKIGTTKNFGSPYTPIYTPGLWLQENGR